MFSQLFQSIYHSQDDYNTALYYVDRGIEFCARMNALFCQLLFQLTKAMVKEFIGEDVFVFTLIVLVEIIGERLLRCTEFIKTMFRQD